MVPYEFSTEQIDKTRSFIIKSIKDNSRFVNGKVLGSPYVFYKDIAKLLNCEIESEGDGDRLGLVAAEASKLEFQKHKLLISAVVVSQEFRRPGGGFYRFSSDMGLFPLNGKPDPDGLKELQFWCKHIEKIVEYYGRK